MGFGFLIDPINRSWRKNLLEAYFPYVIQEAVMNIHLRIRAGEDIQFWNGDKYGRFSIKSAYTLITNIDADSDFNGASSWKISYWQSIPIRAWKRIWSSSTAPKIMGFHWRACVHGLASGEDLIHRKIPIDPNCGICGEEKESIKHILFFCPIARVSWFRSNLSYRL
ncbi:hypothetical protein NE237_010166 [Protea cynaroides]|uniref:Reverse transcriptase zinc-binding domain-containing protein n=1 Tax=Protea cynaroides TaxID=273540 RepID=A0A9Q0L019_9MAGN|nr:hypothetical protein NE237_010166 [Protea cynaroides]